MIERIDTSVDGRRFYQELNDNKERLWCYASNTTIIDEVYPKDAFLIQWIREQGLGGQAIFEKAGDEGTEAHIAIDTLIRLGSVSTVEMSLKVKRCVQAFLDWFAEFKPEILESEQMLVNHEYKFAGTRDLLCKLDVKIGKEEYKGTYVIDYKTSSSVQDKHKIQNSGYWLCTAPSYKTAILHLGNRTKKGYSFIDYDAQEYADQFIHFNKTFKMLHPNIEPKLEEYPLKFTLSLKK